MTIETKRAGLVTFTAVRMPRVSGGQAEPVTWGSVFWYEGGEQQVVTELDQDLVLTGVHVEAPYAIRRATLEPRGGGRVITPGVVRHAQCVQHGPGTITVTVCEVKS